MIIESANKKTVYNTNSKYHGCGMNHKHITNLIFYVCGEFLILAIVITETDDEWNEIFYNKKFFRIYAFRKA